MRNLVDLAIAAAFIQDRNYYEQSGWDLGVFANEDQLPVEVFPAPRQVETAINAVMKGSRLITPIGGGVHIQAHKAVAKENIQTDAKKTIARQYDAVDLSHLKPSQWWWDSAR